MAETCGICKRGVRAGDSLGKVRLAEEDMQDMDHPKDKVPGLYSACPDCIEAYRPAIAERLGKKPEEVSPNDLF